MLDFELGAVFPKREEGRKSSCVCVVAHGLLCIMLQASYLLRSASLAAPYKAAKVVI